MADRRPIRTPNRRTTLPDLLQNQEAIQLKRDDGDGATEEEGNSFKEPRE